MHASNKFWWTEKILKPTINWKKVDFDIYEEKISYKLEAFEKVGGSTLPPDVALYIYREHSQSLVKSFQVHQLLNFN